MKTEQLVALLAAGAGPVPPHAVARRFAAALGGGVLGALVLLPLTLGPRPDLAEAAQAPVFWMKLAFAAALAAAALLATARLARPGMRLGHVGLGLALPLLLVWALGAAVLVTAGPGERAALVLGSTWQTCPFNIALLSLPLFIALFWAMKGLAPTRLALAGAGTGLLAGALGALVYALHCPESSAPFLGIWYVLGMAIPTAAGALLGPRLLRW